MSMIRDEIIAEVTSVRSYEKYLHGYEKPATKGTQLGIVYGADHTTMRTAELVIPGDLPIGTRFKITIEQLDEVTPAVINRGALPVVNERKLIEGVGGTR